MGDQLKNGEIGGESSTLQMKPTYDFRNGSADKMIILKSTLKKLDVSGFGSSERVAINFVGRSDKAEPWPDQWERRKQEWGQAEQGSQWEEGNPSKAVGRRGSEIHGNIQEEDNT